MSNILLCYWFQKPEKYVYFFNIVLIISVFPEVIYGLLLAARRLGMTDGDYAFLVIRQVFHRGTEDQLYPFNFHNEPVKQSYFYFCMYIQYYFTENVVLLTHVLHVILNYQKLLHLYCVNINCVCCSNHLFKYLIIIFRNTLACLLCNGISPGKHLSI